MSLKPGLTALAVALAGGWTLPLAAQQTTDLSRDRVGRDASPQELGDFAEPPENPLVVPPVPDAAPMPSYEGVGMVALTGVQVATRGASPVVAGEGWLPDPAARDIGLQLSVEPGEVLDAAWVEEQFTANGMVGAQIGVERLIALTQLINRSFLANGFVNSGVLYSGIRDGAVLELQLVNGALVSADGAGSPIDVTFRDDKRGGLTAGYVRRRFARTASGAFNATELDREFRLLASDPAIRSVDAELLPGRRPGEALLSVTVVPAPRVDAYASFANSRSPAVGGERIAIGETIRNLVMPGDLLSAEVGWTSGEPDYFIEYAAQLGAGGTGLFFRGGENKAAVVDPVLLPLDIASEEWSFEGGVTQAILNEPLMPAEGDGNWHPSRKLTLGLSFAKRVSRTYLFGRPFSFAPGSVDGRSAYTVARLSADWLQRGVNSVLAFSLTGTLGLDGTRSGILGIPTPKTDFKVLVGQASYARRLTDSGLELRLRLVGQLSNSLLYPGEKLSLGGEYSVRGYRENLLLADQGALGSIELLHPFDLFEDQGSKRFNPGAFIFSIFADAGLGRNRLVPDPRPGEIVSVGAQLSWVPSDAIEVTASYGEALIEPVGIVNRDLQDKGIHFRVTIRPLRF